MKEPFLQGADLLADIRQAPTSDADLSIWWLGQSGFLVYWNSYHLLFDPYLSDSLTHKYAQTDKPHIRMTRRVIEPAQLDFIDVVSSSHLHTDHLDRDTLVPLIHANKELTLVIPEANRSFVADRLNMPLDFPKGINAGEQLEVGPFVFQAIPAAHNALETDTHGNYKYLGYVVQFGSWTLYHSGDTLWYDDLVDWLSPFAIDIAFLPINGNIPARKVAGNLNVEEAAQLGRAIGAGIVIPCHYDMFTFNTAEPEDFAEVANAIGQPYHILENGERLTVTRGE